MINTLILILSLTTQTQPYNSKIPDFVSKLLFIEVQEDWIYGKSELPLLQRVAASWLNDMTCILGEPSVVEVKSPQS